jgi:hypothetical protein
MFSSRFELNTWFICQCEGKMSSYACLASLGLPWTGNRTMPMERKGMRSEEESRKNN